MQLTITLFFCTTSLFGYIQGAEYSWRYFGMLRSGDMVIAGWDDSLYEYYFIGQGIGYLNSTYGEVPSKITPSSTNITIAMHDGLVSAQIATVKVLCTSNSTSFKWLPTTSTTFWDDIYSNGTVPVVGGFEFTVGADPIQVVPSLLIGRYQNYIGKIVTFPGEPYMAYISKNNDILTMTEFEVFVTVD